MNELKISLSEVSNTASQIRVYNQRLDETLNYVSKVMNDLNSIWQSDGQTTLIDRFNRFARKFVEEYETFESYAQFLDNTVSDYDSLETTINANASNFE